MTERFCRLVYQVVGTYLGRRGSQSTYKDAAMEPVIILEKRSSLFSHVD